MKRARISSKQRVRRMIRLIKASTDIRPLDQRESPLNTRKGMPKVKCKGFFEVGDYKQMNLNDELFL